jgi:hypothetical protein
MSVIALFVLSFALGAWAYEIQLNNMMSIEKVKNLVLDHSDAVYDESVHKRPLLQKHDIMRMKIQISSEFEKKFINNKSRIYQLNSEIFQLNKIKFYLKQLSQLKKNQIELKNDYDSKIQIVNNIYKDEYIPGIFAWHLKIPLQEESKMNNLVRHHMLKTMVSQYGMEDFLATTFVENGIIQNTIRSRTFGKIEEDGIRNYDDKMIVDYYSTQYSNFVQFFSVSFFRFKPFFFVEKSDNFQNFTRQNEDNDHGQNPYFKCWDLSNRNALSNTIKEIRSQISYDFSSDVAPFQNYILSLGNISEMVSSAQKRIKQIVDHFQELKTKYLEQYQFNKVHIDRLKRTLSEQLNQIGLNENVTQTDINLYIKDRKIKMAKFENNFEYQFVIKESVPAANFKTAIKHTIENGFAKMDKMVHQQAMSIEYIVNNGSLDEKTEQTMLIKPCFSMAEIIPFVDQGDAGVMIALSVKYKTNAQNPLPVNDLPDQYIENAMGVNIHMKLIQSGNQLFYISKSEITKQQYMTFVNKTNAPLSEYVKNSYCLERIQADKDHYAMKCVSGDGIKAFLEWLGKHSNRHYSKASQSQMLIAEPYKLYQNKNFRISVNIK